jgi:MoaA/NifB/PqqE/SkfB family radical SAM enzyme
MFRILDVQQFVPARLKFALKPYYRKIFPNRLHALLYPTFRCNYKCSYCPVVTKFDFGKVWDIHSELPAARWIEALDRLPPAVIYILGGEPLLYRELPQLVNELPAKHSLVGLVTNLSVPVHVYQRLRKRIHLNVSFHREYTTQEQFIEKIRALKDRFHMCVNLVATPENMPVLEEIRDTFQSNDIDLHVDPYVDPRFQYTPAQQRLLERYIQYDRNPEQQLNFADFSEKRCSAGRNYINVAPDGEVYTCASGLSYVHSTLYGHLLQGSDVSGFRIGNLMDAAFRLHETDITCSLPCPTACDRDAAIIRPIELTRRPAAAGTTPSVNFRL